MNTVNSKLIKNLVYLESIKYYLQNYLKVAGIKTLIPESTEEDYITFKFNNSNVNLDTLSYLLDPTEDEASDRFMIGGIWYKAELIGEDIIKVTKF